MYGGTKSEMERLVKDAAKIDKSVKSNSLSYANIVKAIHAVQENLDITGTTAKEAEHTISGSLASMKSAWGNLLPALIQGGDNFDQCVDNLVDTVLAFKDNVMPAIEKALSGFGTLIEKLAPTLEKEFPKLVNELLPPLIKSATSLFSGLIQALPTIIATVVKELPAIAGGLVSAITQALGSVAGNWKGASIFSGIFGDVKGIVAEIIPTLSNLAKKFVEVFNQESVLNTIKQVLTGITLAIKAIWMIAGPIIDLIANNLDKIVPVVLFLGKAFLALKLAVAAFNFVMAANPITWIIVAVVALIAVIALCVKHWDKIKEAASACWNKIKGAWGAAGNWFNEKVVQPIKTFLTGVFGWIKTKLETFKTFLSAAIQVVLEVLRSVKTFIYNHVIAPIIKFVKGLATVVMVVVLGLIGLICQKVIKIAQWVNQKVVQPIWNAICTVWGKISDWVSTNVVQPVVKFFTALWNKIRSIVQSVVNTIRAVWGKISGWVSSNVIQPVGRFFTGLWNKLKSGVAAVRSAFYSILGKISDWVNKNVIQPVVNLFKRLWNKIRNIANNIRNTLVDAFKSAWDKVTGVWNGLKDFFKGIWKGLKDTGGVLKNTLVGIWKDAVSAIAKPVNKLIGGANWVLEKLGSSTRVAEWKPYAKGTDGHKGGNALVNDGRGAELVQMPNGRTFIPNGRNVFMPNAPKGMKVLPAEQTANLLGKSSPTFRYKDGTGLDIWNFFDNAKGLAGKVIDKFVSYDGLSGYALDVGKAMVSKAKGALSDWVSNMFSKFGGKDISSYVASAGVEQWRSTVVQALKMEGLYSEANVKRTLYQMQTESGGNPRAINLWDSNAKKGMASRGLMQVIPSTFKAYARPGYDQNIYDPLSNILASVRYAKSRYGSLEKAYQGHGYSNGVGFKSINLPQYKPETASVRSNTTNSTENNTYAPVFNLTISGTTDDRAMAQKVKNWVAEAMEETFEGLARRNARSF